MYYINNDLYTNTRYDIQKFMEFDIDSFSMLDSYFCSQVKRLPYSGALTINSTQEYRPDLVSWDLYGDTMYWWIILLYNDLTSPTDLKSGTVLVYPALPDLESLYFTLATKQKTKDIEAQQ